MIRSSRFVLPLVLLVAGTTACGRKQPQAAPAPTVDADAARRDSIARAEADRRAREERERAERERAERERMEALNAARGTLTATIYFDYDRSDLTAGARQTLDAKLPILRSNGEIRILISGHTDERGSDEYNLALGQRRAAAAKRYLVQNGIAEGRIGIRSYGEERPVCEQSDESCWSQNRRDEFEITSGEIMVARP